MQTKQNNFSYIWCWLVLSTTFFSLCTDHLNVLFPLQYFLSAFYQTLYKQKHFSNDLLLNARQGISSFYSLTRKPIIEQICLVP